MASSKGRQGSAEKSVPHTRIEDESKFEECYRFGAKLGQGTFGIVREATNIKTEQCWAIKAVNKEKAGSSTVKLLEREVSILKRVQHENIIHLEEVFETSKKMYLVMELCERGELADILKVKGQLPEDDVKTVMKKLASAISYLHKNDIVHRDLKLENILVGRNPEDPADTFHIKVTDFGLSVVKDGPGHENMMQAFCGTPMYMSPEIIDNKTYSQQCDVWAMGVIAFMLLVGSPPFKSKDEDSLYELIKKGDMDFSSPLWASISKGAKDCICGMLKVDPAHRLTASEVVDHSWISGQEGQGRTNVLEMMKQFRLNQDMDDDGSAIIGGAADGDAEKPNSAGVESARGGSAGNDTKNKPKTTLGQYTSLRPDFRRASTGNLNLVNLRRQYSNLPSTLKPLVSLGKTTRSPSIPTPNSTLPVQRTPKSGMKTTTPSSKTPTSSKSPSSNRQSSVTNRSPVTSGKSSSGNRTSQTPIKPMLNNNNTPKIKKTEKKV